MKVNTTHPILLAAIVVGCACSFSSAVVAQERGFEEDRELSEEELEEREERERDRDRREHDEDEHHERDHHDHEHEHEHHDGHHEEEEFHRHMHSLEVELHELEVAVGRLTAVENLAKIAGDEVATAAYGLLHLDHMFHEPEEAIVFLEESLSAATNPGIKRLIRVKLAELYSHEESEKARDHLRALLVGE